MVSYICCLYPKSCFNTNPAYDLVWELNVLYEYQNKHFLFSTALLVGLRNGQCVFFEVQTECFNHYVFVASWRP